MKIKGIVRLEWDDDIVKRLQMHVKFKLPDQIFKQKVSKTLTSEWWVGEKDRYLSEEEFWKETFDVLSNKDYLERLAKDMIIDYIKKKSKNTYENNSIKEIQLLIQGLNNNFEVEVEHKE